MGVFLAIILVSIIVGIIIAFVTLRINGDDGKPWPHMSEGDEHRWQMRAHDRRK